MLSRKITDSSGGKLLSKDIIKILLLDENTGENLIWATNDYFDYRLDFAYSQPIGFDVPTGKFKKLLMPNEAKSGFSTEQANHIINELDNEWFGKRRKRFNSENADGISINYYKVRFPDTKGRTWRDYVTNIRIETDCGDAPLTTSRYERPSGFYIPPKSRIGALDRKLRIISENVPNAATFSRYAEKALKSTYAFSVRGDRLFTARVNAFFAAAEYYNDFCGKYPNKKRLISFAKIIRKNFVQIPAGAVKEIQIYDHGKKCFIALPGSDDNYKHTIIQTEKLP